MRRFLLLTFLSLTCLRAEATLDPRARETLRAELERSFNRVDLAIRNATADERELNRQARMAEVLRLFERVPLTDQIPKLKAELVESAKKAGVQLADTRLVSRKRLPLVEELRFAIRVKAPQDKLKLWTASWPDALDRWIEPAGETQASKGEWLVQAVAFRFLPAKREPEPVLSARTVRLSQGEPQLWDYVTKIRELTPKAALFLRKKEELKLLSARADFLLIRIAR